MHFTTITSLLLATLLNPLSSYALPANHVHTKRADPVAQLTAMLKNPNACPTSTGECVTPADALMPILDGFARYGITTAPEQAAIVSLMAFESVDFQYNHNISPGRPGQGTRAMLMPDNVKKYIDSMPQMASAEAAANGDLNALLKLVQDNEHSFAAASWYYSAVCSDAVKQGVRTGGKAGWSAYITGCVSTTVTDDRVAYWEKACQQLSVPTS